MNIAGNILVDLQKKCDGVKDLGQEISIKKFELKFLLAEIKELHGVVSKLIAKKDEFSQINAKLDKILDKK